MCSFFLDALRRRSGIWSLSAALQSGRKKCQQQKWLPYSITSSTTASRDGEYI